MRLRRLCFEIFALRRFFREPIRVSAARRVGGSKCKHVMRRTATSSSLFARNAAKRQLVNQTFPRAPDCIHGPAFRMAESHDEFETGQIHTDFGISKKIRSG